MPNSVMERAATGMAPWPRSAVVYVACRGQGATPGSAAQLCVTALGRADRSRPSGDRLLLAPTGRSIS